MKTANTYHDDGGSDSGHDASGLSLHRTCCRHMTIEGGRCSSKRQQYHHTLAQCTRCPCCWRYKKQAAGMHCVRSTRTSDVQRADGRPLLCSYLERDVTGCADGRSMSADDYEHETSLRPCRIDLQLHQRDTRTATTLASSINAHKRQSQLMITFDDRDVLNITLPSSTTSTSTVPLLHLCICGFSTRPTIRCPRCLSGCRTVVPASLLPILPRRIVH